MGDVAHRVEGHGAAVGGGAADDTAGLVDQPVGFQVDHADSPGPAGAVLDVGVEDERAGRAGGGQGDTRAANVAADGQPGRQRVGELERAGGGEAVGAAKVGDGVGLVQGRRAARLAGQGAAVGGGAADDAAGLVDQPVGFQVDHADSPGPAGAVLDVGVEDERAGRAGGGQGDTRAANVAADGQPGGVGQLERADAGERAEVGNDVVAGQGHCAASVALQCAGGDDAALRDRAADGLAGHAQGHRPGPGCPAGGDGP